MSFTYNDSDSGIASADYVSAVRALVQDTDVDTAELSNERITALYSQTNGSNELRNLSTAVLAARDLERRYRKQATFSSGGTSVQLGQRADSWAKVVEDLNSELFAATMRDAGSTGSVLIAGRGPLYFDDGITGLLA